MIVVFLIVSILLPLALVSVFSLRERSITNKPVWLSGLVLPIFWLGAYKLRQMAVR